MLDKVKEIIEVVVELQLKLLAMWKVVSYFILSTFEKNHRICCESLLPELKTARLEDEVWW